MVLTTKKLIQMYFDIHRDKSIPVNEKKIVFSKIQQLAEKTSIKSIKEEAASEMTSSVRGSMYKLFCQCVALTGKIGY